MIQYIFKDFRVMHSEYDCRLYKCSRRRDTVVSRTIARSISLDIQQRSKENPKLWPPVPQDIIG